MPRVSSHLSLKPKTLNPTPKVKLSEAERIADRIATELQPFCTRLEIAGSIRRGLGEVNDIDLVIIPRDQSALRDRVLRNSTAIQDGPHNLLVRLQNGVQLDIFFAHAGKADLLESTPSNWGSILLCRTGSKEHNIKLCQRAARLGLAWKTMEGIYPALNRNLNPNLPIASATEQDIFRALEMDYLPPESRI